MECDTGSAQHSAAPDAPCHCALRGRLAVQVVSPVSAPVGPQGRRSAYVERPVIGTLMNGPKRKLVEKIRSGDGTIEEEEVWLAQLKKIDPYFSASDAMLYLETGVQARREYETLRAQIGVPLDKAQLVELVQKIGSSEGTEADIQAWLMLVESNVPHPAVSDLLFYPDKEMTPEEIVEVALSYQPIQLSGPVEVA